MSICICGHDKASHVHCGSWGSEGCAECRCSRFDENKMNGTCKWKQYGIVTFLTGCKKRPVVSDTPSNEWKFCPYCGKKIKVVK